MEQQSLIILAIIFVAIYIALQPNECDCTSAGAATAPAMSAYLRAKRPISGKKFNKVQQSA